MTRNIAEEPGLTMLWPHKNWRPGHSYKCGLCITNYLYMYTREHVTVYRAHGASTYFPGVLDCVKPPSEAAVSQRDLVSVEFFSSHIGRLCMFSNALLAENSSVSPQVELTSMDQVERHMPWIDLDSNLGGEGGKESCHRL